MCLTSWGVPVPGLWPATWSVLSNFALHYHLFDNKHLPVKVPGIARRQGKLENDVGIVLVLYKAFSHP